MRPALDLGKGVKYFLILTLAKVDSAGRVTLLPGTTFLRINESLIHFDTCSAARPVLCLSLTYIDHYLLSPYQAVENGFASFHLYVCAAFLKHFSSEIEKENDFQVSV